MKIKWCASVCLISFFSFTGLTQESDVFSKHSIGLEYQLTTGNPNIGITYRKFKEDSRYNFRASLFLGGSNNFTFSNQQSDLFYRTNDSLVPFLGVNNSNLNSSSFRRLEIGMESVKELKKVDLIAGFGINIGHVTTSRFASVYEAQEEEVIKNGIAYYQIININSSDQINLNSLTSTLNYLNAGLSFNAGLKFDVGSKLYCTVMLNMRSNVQWAIAERNDYLNDTYKEHIPSQSGSSTFNFDSDLAIGMHYKF